jgi:hypothetical protein
MFPQYGEAVVKKAQVIEQREALVKERHLLQETLETHPSFAVMSTWQHRRIFYY